MSRSAPERSWWSAGELADARLPDLPDTRQGVDAWVARLGLRSDPARARRRKGRGGGWEYHWSALPPAAQAVLLKPVTAVQAVAPDLTRDEVWAWFEGLPERAKAKARDRLALIQRVEALEAALGRSMAVETEAAAAKVSARAVWGWIKVVAGIDPADRLAWLAPRYRAPGATEEAPAPGDFAPFLDLLKAGYLRPGAPSFRGCWEDAAKLARARGRAVMTERTARRWIERNVPRPTLILAREGAHGLARCYPPQIRDRSGMTAMEGVNADFHKFDTFVEWPGIERPVRPQLVGFQDIYSGKVLSWRLDLDPNKVSVMSAFGEMIETYGIPRHVLFDNGREFANKWLTGGAPTRFRFKVREDDPLGVLTQMGITIHWATPGHGQAKPIERAFRDFADRIARDPRFHGAWTGNRVDAKPSNYGSRAIPLDQFLRVVDERIREHNARPGRLSDTCRGRSFDETFAASYAEDRILKATEGQQRLWLMGQEVRILNRSHGRLKLFDNHYFSDWMALHAGERVVARFDPENLHAGVYLYRPDGSYLGPAACSEKVGFFDMVGAQLHKRAQAQRRRAERKLLETIRPVSPRDLARELDALPVPETPLIEAKVVELAPARHRRPVIEAPLPVPDTADEERLKVYTADFTARGRVKREAAEAVKGTGESAVERFWRALEIERRSEAGEPISEQDAAFWTRMQRLPEYRAQRTLYERFGDQAIG